MRVILDITEDDQTLKFSGLNDRLFASMCHDALTKYWESCGLNPDIDVVADLDYSNLS